MPYRHLVPDLTPEADEDGSTAGAAQTFAATAPSNSRPAPKPLTEQERLLPLANIAHMMASMLPKNAKISKEAKQLMQELTTEFICFVTSECNDVSLSHNRKSICFDDLVEGFENVDLGMFIPIIKMQEEIYQKRQQRKLAEQGKSKAANGGDAPAIFPQPSNGGASSDHGSTSTSMIAGSIADHLARHIENHDDDEQLATSDSFTTFVH